MDMNLSVVQEASINSFLMIDLEPAQKAAGKADGIQEAQKVKPSRRENTKLVE